MWRFIGRAKPKSRDQRDLRQAAITLMRVADVGHATSMTELRPARQSRYQRDLRRVTTLRIWGRIGGHNEHDGASGPKPDL